ncbi:transporter substrate-binding domain-containing protein [Mesorhizobium sp.]|uniref:transporter substrate-binding domain-containing protein n=2 Tax=Mesorhizobium TaxID=68287 RepID=UPI0025DB0B50|nr:transporter substrate-binding domain-containing protein [Mesorhizobium sp.]
MDLAKPGESPEDQSKRNEIVSMLSRMSIATVSLLLLCALSMPGSAGPVLDRVRQKAVLVVAVDPAWPPFSWRKDDGSFDGFDVDVLTGVARRLGVEVRFEVAEFSAVISGRWQGAWDVSPSVTPTKQRAEKLDFPAVYAFGLGSLAVHRDNTTIRTPADASGKRIGAVRSSEYEKYLTREPFDILDIPPIKYQIDRPVVVPFETSEGGYESLAKGNGVELDGIVDSLSTLMSEIGRGRPIKIIGQPLLYTPTAIAIEKGDPEFAAELKGAIDRLREDGMLKFISLKWFGIDTTAR